MNLPVIPDLPIPPLPIEIPLLMHPAVVHFAIAIPIVILLLELVNIFMKRRAISVTSLLLMLLTMIVFVVVYVTGKTDGSEGYMLLNEAAQADFKEHKLIGLYLVYGTAVLFVLKLLSMLGIGLFRFLFTLVLIGFVGANLLQGKKGGNLVYNHGMNITAVNEAGNTIDYLNDDIADLEEEIEALEADIVTLKEDLTCKDVQESVDTVLSEGDVVEVDLDAEKEEVISKAEEATEEVASQAEEATEELVSAAEGNVTAVE
jgi:uncharacterized membrane protein